MKTVRILVEGQTEETFVKTILQPHLSRFSVATIPTIIATKRIKSGMKFKGGVPSYDRVKREILHLLGDSSASMVTTMLDYYALPPSFPGKVNLQGKTCFERVRYLENALLQDIKNRKFHPYYSLHEFEALLFTAPNQIAQAFVAADKEPDLVRIRNQFNSPEEIDDGPQTAPSQRLEKLFPSYDKPVYGALIASRIGLELMRKECSHFQEWLQTLEQVGGGRI